MTIRSRLLALAGAAALTACVSSGAQSVPPALTLAKANGGYLLTDIHGMTLYTFDLDMPGQSNCHGECAAKWPAVLASGYQAAQGDYSVIKRDDHAWQWAYKGQPLYLYAQDYRPGDMTGHGIGDVWHAVLIKKARKTYSYGGNSGYGSSY